ncbi:MAG TPA: bifunctional DNA-formamidopyrimidine glycosylase/DNA-(apurinic or apyrimidinic site) lyase [Solirubrobacteraceae bacterium]|jgi:formamidopyrimidine-DNA glycosylase
MPELPEVETIRRQLAPLVEGRRLLEVEILDARWSRPLEPRELAEALTGRRVLRLGRRGKYLLWELQGDVHLAQHLRMTGAVLAEPDPEPAHTRVRIRLGARAGDRDGAPEDAPADRGTRAGLRVVVSDPRRFGTGELLLGSEALERFLQARLGLEPFDDSFTAEHLREQLRGRTAPIKAMLLDQRRVAGVGNIYADEALFRAGIHPLRPAGALTLAQAERLRDGVLEALSAGIDAKGASIDDFRHVDGVRGSFQDRFLVHLREGEPCVRCGREIVKMVVAGRGTYVCERCQPRPRLRRRAARPGGRPAPPRSAR